MQKKLLEGYRLFGNEWHEYEDADRSEELVVVEQHEGGVYPLLIR